MKGKKFTLDTKLEDGDAGKIILYKKGDTTGAAASRVPGIGTFLKSECPERVETDEETLETLMDLRTSIEERVGFHCDIKHDGERVLGGSLYLILEGKIYLIGTSTYGPIHKEAVEKCVESKGLKVVAYEGSMSRDTLEKYIC